MTKTFEFVKPFEKATNVILTLTETCFVSYNPHPHRDTPMFESENGCDETALCIDGEYLVLNGDFRQAYLEAAQRDVAECLEVFKRNREEHVSIWSSDKKTDEDYLALLAHLMGGI